MNIYDKRYCANGELGFPCASRTYFDSLCHEFTYTTIKQKLLDIAYLLWNGYDVRNAIHETYSDEHPSVKESDVRHTVCILLSGLTGHTAEDTEYMTEQQTTDGLIDIFFSEILRRYRLPGIDSTINHYFSSTDNITEAEIKLCNPWGKVAYRYDGCSFLLSDRHNLVCDADLPMLEEFNSTAKEDYKYKLNVPVYPWYGNPLRAKVIVLSLNPGYVERESTIARVLMNLPDRYTEGYAEHLRTMIKFQCYNFLPDDSGLSGMTYRDLANLHQNWYWEDRLRKAFVNDDTGLTFEDLNRRFAVVQYIGYSSKKYAPFKNGRILPSQNFTKQLIRYIHTNTDAIFIVARNVSTWKTFLGDIWNEERFIETGDYLGQRLTKNILKDRFSEVVAAFKKQI